MADEGTKLLDGLHGRQGKFFPQGDPRILGWLKEARDAGDQINKEAPGFDKIDQMQDYIMGDQLTKDRPPYAPKVVINRTKKAILTKISALTDLRPLFGFRSANIHFDQHAYLMNRYTQAWWVNSNSDLQEGNCIKYAAAGGAGDLVVEYDPNFLGGDTRLMARDPRDTLPIRPSREDSIQSWRGVMLRESHTVAALAAKWPEYTAAFDSEAGSSLIGAIYTRFRQAAAKLISTMGTLDGIDKGERKKTPSNPELIVYRTYLNDDSINTSLKTMPMGEPGTNWFYLVKPGDPLYPQKRLMVHTSKIMMYDGPSHYWHGMYPVSRLKLESWPWLFAGNPSAADRLPIQDAINMLVNAFILNFMQAVRRGAVGDSKAIPADMWKRFDPNLPGFKLRTNPTMGEAFKLMDPAQLPVWALDFLGQLIGQFDDLSGVANIQQLMQLRQAPAADTIDKFLEAMTPELRLEARQIEVHLRDVADMFKGNTFQWQSTAKRVMILGSAGALLEDFDYDPGNLIPAMKKTDAEGKPTPGYVEQLDASKPVTERAKWFQKLFVFEVQPGSLLAIHSIERQMRDVQLSRQGLLDCWTLADTLGLQNFGAPPPIPLPVKDAPATPGAPPQMEYRVPETITERLIAMQQLGIGMAVNPAGRKASGQEPPQPEQKTDAGGAPRPVVSES
jgi:hypothetical protein